MNIACIAWGSLLWKAEPLRLASAWMADGPLLPLEFCRVGDGGELATALCDGAPVMQSRWALLDVPDIATALELLRQREQIGREHPEWLGSIPERGGTPHDGLVSQWLHGRDINAAVWTALPPRSAGVEGRKPTAAEAVAYLDGLTGDTRAHAEDYIRRTPADIATPYRKAIEQQLGWLPHRSPR